MIGRQRADTQVAVKPVFVQLLHSGAYEGPCRVGRKEDLDPDKEEQRGEEQFRKWTRQLESEVSAHAQLLEPVKLQWRDDWHLPEEQIRKLNEDAAETDLYLLSGGLSQYPAVAVGRRFGKPVAMVGTVMTVDVAAYLRSRGMEGYAPFDFEQLNRLIALLRVRKAIAQTRILQALEGDVISVGVVSTIYDIEDLQDHLGVSHHGLPAAALLERMDALAPESLAEAERLTDDLIAGAEQNDMSREDILPSVRFYVAVQEAMEALECNAFAIPCFELCARGVPERHRVTFCLAHSLLKDKGYPAACEGDVNVLMAMGVLMHLSGKSTYMGNCSLLSKPRNIIRIGHSVPGLKMKGLDAPNLPYAIRPFTVGGWGVTLRYDFSRDLGEPVTVARFDPRARKLLVAVGEIVGGDGYDKIGCSLGAHISINDVVDFFDKQQDFGHHMAMAYGDYAEDIGRLGRMMGVQIIRA